LALKIPAHLQEVFANLPQEEQQRILDIDDPDFREMLISVHQPSAAIADDAKLQADSIQEIVVKAASNEQLRLFSPFPTELTRCSPFFPLSTQEMAKRPFLEDLVIADHSWGQVRFSGQKLSVYDEDMLMILLAAINETSRSRTAEGYTYKGSLSRLLKIKGINNPGQNHREEAYASYKRMSGSTFEIDTSPTRKNKPTRGGKSVVTNIIANLSYDRKAGLLEATVNPYFYEMYCRGEVTWIEIEIRTKLKSPIAKALHRFIMSHAKDFWTGPLMLLAEALNLDTNLPKIKIRERLKKAIAELVEYDVLTSGSSIAADNVTLHRVPRKQSKRQQIECRQ